MGRCVVPGAFYQQMKDSRIIFLDISRELRAVHLVKHYAVFEPGELKECIRKISKRLGGDRTREALESVDNADFESTAMITLHYYDKTYMFSLQKNHEVFEVIPSDRIDPAYNAAILLKYIHEEKR